MGIDNLVIIWAVLVIVFLIVEGATAGLASIWFAAGALVALVCALLDFPLWLQIVLFLVVSIVTLVLTRPLARRFVNGRTKATNADRVIGQIATVTERVDNIAGTGAASVGGRVWTARTKKGCILEPGQVASVASIQGVKLILVPITTKNNAETAVQ